MVTQITTKTAKENPTAMKSEIDSEEDDFKNNFKNKAERAR